MLNRFQTICNSRASEFSQRFNRTTSINNTRSRQQDFVGREGRTKGTGKCRKTSIDNARSRRKDSLCQPKSIFNNHVWVLATQRWKRSPPDSITIALYNYSQPSQFLKSIFSSFRGDGMAFKNFLRRLNNK